MNINYAQILEEIRREVASFSDEGKVAAFIPELASVDPRKFGIHLITTEGEHFSTGDADEKFSIQSISKVLTLSLALMLSGEKIWERVGVEPSGNAFNALIQLEYEQGKPRNPFISVGALVVADMLVTQLAEPKKDFLEFVRNLADCPEIDFNYAVAQSEKSVGFRNAALANLLKSFGNLENEAEVVLDFYFHQCSIKMTCRELASSFLFLANEGKTPHKREQILNQSQIKRLNALMQTCGFYDESGEFAYKVGLPGKSGIGGGIVAIHPQKYAVTVWSPRLNEKGNSVLGMRSLEFLTTKTGMSIF